MKTELLYLEPSRQQFSPDREAKARAHLAFLTYEKCVREGDVAAALAARERFLSASASLAQRRIGRGSP